jgi:branched-chain amino acid transport system substrate-binding protein
VIHDKQRYGEGIATRSQADPGSQGTKVTSDEGINAGDKDFSSMISNSNEAGVDFVYYGGYCTQMGLLLRQSAEKRSKRQVHGP